MLPCHLHLYSIIIFLFNSSTFFNPLSSLPSTTISIFCRLTYSLPLLLISHTRTESWIRAGNELKSAKASLVNIFASKLPIKGPYVFKERIKDIKKLISSFALKSDIAHLLEIYWPISIRRCHKHMCISRIFSHFISLYCNWHLAMMKSIWFCTNIMGASYIHTYVFIFSFYGIYPLHFYVLLQARWIYTFLNPLLSHASR